MLRCYDSHPRLRTRVVSPQGVVEVAAPLEQALFDRHFSPPFQSVPPCLVVDSVTSHDSLEEDASAM
jgi:hypothetical protein